MDWRIRHGAVQLMGQLPGPQWQLLDMLRLDVENLQETPIFHVKIHGFL